MEDGLRYKDKVIIITGGSSGIGKGCVKVFVRHGSKVVFCSNNDTQGKEVELEMKSAGHGEATFIVADMLVEPDVQNLIDKTVEKYGRIDCVINNAGWHPPLASIDDLTSDDFRSLLDLNVIGYFRASKYALPHLRKTEGNIINISSMSAHHAKAYGLTYAATKGAVSAMTRALAIDEATYNVRVNAISPGCINTPLMTEVVSQSLDPAAKIQTLCNYCVLGRVGQPEEIGLTCLYLATDATFCTGIDMQVSGGSALSYANKNRRV